MIVLAADPALQLAVSGGGSSAVKLFLLMSVLSFASAIVLAATSFTRIVIVLSFVRQALGTPQAPPNQVVIALSLAMTCFVMAPTATRVWQEALDPYFEDRIGHTQCLERAGVPVLEFVLRQTREGDLRLFYEISGRDRPTRADEVPLTVAIPAFLVSELTTAFRMGLAVLIPMLVVDLLVASVLMALGMMMVPPNLVSLPLKLGIFLAADGWHLVVGALARSF